ncbi:holo-ACP synthase [Streptomyces sp. NPDC050617]|uniref:holo-ACP synthase n=1 Tax=Streptomyces sp. NPDC050617 TaxID=3154628 RepID=UPI00343DF3B3
MRGRHVTTAPAAPAAPSASVAASPAAAPSPPPAAGVLSGLALRTGADILPVSRVEGMVRGSGERFLATLLTPGELSACATDNGTFLPAVAGRLAAKEAVFKTFHTPLSSLPWLSIEIRKAPGGWPEAVLHGAARRLADAAGLADLSLSISHDGGFAFAVAVATVRR